jgi:hypothetical protein
VQQERTETRHVAFEKANNALNPFAARKVAAHGPSCELIANMRSIEAEHVADVADHALLDCCQEWRHAKRRAVNRAGGICWTSSASISP